MAAFAHELVEFRLVLGVAQLVEELHEFALFFFETAQRLGAVLVKGAIAARGSIATAAPSVRRPCIRSIRRCIRSMRRCHRSPLPCVQHAIRPLPIKYPRITRPSGQNRIKLTTVSAIQAGLPMSSNCAAIVCMAASCKCVSHLHEELSAPCQALPSHPSTRYCFPLYAGGAVSGDRDPSRHLTDHSSVPKCRL